MDRESCRTVDGTRVTGADPYLPRHGDRTFAVEDYDLDLRYRPRGNHLEGTAVLTVTVLETTTAIELDLYVLRVRRVEVEGATLARWTHRDSKVRLRTQRPLEAGTRLVVTLAYSGTPRPMPGPDGRAGWEELTDGVIVAAQPHGAPSWFPCNDRMDDKASYRIAVTTDTGYRVVANGELVAQTPQGRFVRWEYRQVEPMAAYLATVQIGRYVEEALPSATPAVLVCPPGLLARARSAFTDQGEMLALFASLFGDYPFPRYTVVVTDDVLEIPLESQTLSTFGRNHLSGQWPAQRLIAHELAHQWFGNTVTAASLSDIWLHEGFACYCEWLWSEEAGSDSADDRARHHHAALSGLPQDLLLTAPGAENLFDDRVYKRGALALHEVRLRGGDDRFFALLRTWVERHRFGSVSTSDFEHLVQETCGRAVVQALAPWLHESALPPLSPRR